MHGSEHLRASPVISACFTITFTAISLAVLRDVGIFGGKLMAFMAASFYGISGAGAASPPKVFCLRDRLKMLRIYTFPISAKMVYLETFRDFTYMHLVRNPVRQIHLFLMPRFAAGSYDPVPMIPNGKGPLNAFFAIGTDGLYEQ
jgi:hypothetical protein